MTTRPDIDERVLDEALAWQGALEHDDADWDGYILWLEADPSHRRAFDEISLTERIVDERLGDIKHLRSIEPPAAVPAAARSRRGWLAGAVATAVTLAVGVPLYLSQPSDITYATARGETRQIALGQGMTVALAPSSRLIAKGGKPTSLELAQGDAYFTVAHDPGRPLSIRAGEFIVTDIGTTFGVNLSPHAITVSVAEGHVAVTGGRGEPAKVSAGHQLIARPGDGLAQVGEVSAKDVGAWRQGRLVYSNAPLAVVAADISRYSGKTVVIDSALEDRTFSGVLAIGDGSGLLASLAELTALAFEENGDSVRLGAAAGR